MTRPRKYEVTEKACKGCGRTFSMSDRGIAFPSHFADISFCSQDCRESHALLARGSLKVFLYERVEVDPATGCHNWTGRLMHKGYGVLDWRGRHYRAHRASFEAHIGHIPEGMMVLHSCDNRRCINPEHLRAGTAKENVQDCIDRKRRNQQVVLSSDDIEYIRSSPLTLKELAELFSCSITTVHRARTKLNKEAGRT